MNIYNHRRFSALQSHMVHSNPARKQLAMLLFATGKYPSEAKTFKTPFRGEDAIWNPIFDFYNRTKVVNLKDICRRDIRAHLIRIDPRVHLFHRIPKIGLPSLLVSYLLYNVLLGDTKK